MKNLPRGGKKDQKKSRFFERQRPDPVYLHISVKKDSSFKVCCLLSVVPTGTALFF
jgi:hypothetical protein